ncbi:hypothetical protein PAPYR_9967 [Paratrimastix pyriformis]|uniref:Uncharacterized protein n=1 Tax=Paratrimastix pyriformis TaxID=342808 RepID=A0ABQ8U9T3_9EUKA|nr:hypothetical protein PAPYR_9967 [Paratrimastix pyriformis]
MKFRTFYIDVQHLPHRLVPLSLLAASPAPPDLSPPLGLGGSPVMGGAQRSQRSTSAAARNAAAGGRARPARAASDAAARCRDLEGRLSVMAADLEERVAHSDAALTIKRSAPARPHIPRRGGRPALYPPLGGPLRCRAAPAMLVGERSGSLRDI